MLEPDKLTTLYGGYLRAGDVITFSRHYPWWLKLWYHVRYFRHNNPLYKAPRQFVVTSISGQSSEIAPNENEN